MRVRAREWPRAAVAGWLAAVGGRETDRRDIHIRWLTVAHRLAGRHARDREHRVGSGMVGVEWSAWHGVVMAWHGMVRAEHGAASGLGRVATTGGGRGGGIRGDANTHARTLVHVVPNPRHDPDRRLALAGGGSSLIPPGARAARAPDGIRIVGPGRSRKVKDRSQDVARGDAVRFEGL